MSYPYDGRDWSIFGIPVDDDGYDHKLRSGKYTLQFSATGYRLIPGGDSSGGTSVGRLRRTVKPKPTPPATPPDNTTDESKETEV
jgi:hypothetical protein